MPGIVTVGTPSWVAPATHSNFVLITLTMACYAANPGPTHWDAAKQTDRYLAGMLDLWLAQGETTCTLMGYTDADGSMTGGCHVTMGHAPLIDADHIPWASERQETASLFMTEGEHATPTHGSKVTLGPHTPLPHTSGITTASLSNHKFTFAPTLNHTTTPT